MKILVKIFIVCLAFNLLSACDFEVPVADNKFGTQNFVSAIAIIELHKTRNNRYPDSLNQLEFLGDWDGIWLGAVRYEKTNTGYNLFVERGWINEPTLVFPIAFKNGLGLEQTNVIWEEETK